MPFKSQAQMKAAFAGGLGPTMQARASTWASETPNPKGLPEHVDEKKKKSARRSALLHAMKG